MFIQIIIVIVYAMIFFATFSAYTVASFVNNKVFATIRMAVRTVCLAFIVYKSVVYFHVLNRMHSNQMRRINTFSVFASMMYVRIIGYHTFIVKITKAVRTYGYPFVILIKRELSVPVCITRFFPFPTARRCNFVRSLKTFKYRQPFSYNIVFFQGLKNSANATFIQCRKMVHGSFLFIYSAYFFLFGFVKTWFAHSLIVFSCGVNSNEKV